RTAGIGQLFREWGIATPIAVVEAAQGAPALPLIATGGVRSGLDAARALALGARLVGMGFPFLKAASEGEEALRAFMEQFIAELKVAMQLSGASTIPALAGVPAVVTGATREWLELRGFGEVLRSLACRGM
ncbi:MAG TPA: alpha-hydroxy-acid oxidizing protein, partial [Ktedonobacterales bacterium]|nr:alpha-hydroxy-acid oxidizing protein [Ktedonobacterales bacterium]